MDGLIGQLDAGYRGMIQLYKELSDLAESIGKSLTAGEWKEVDALLARKQAIMQAIDAREAEMSRLRGEIQEKLGLDSFSLSSLPKSSAAAQLNNTIAELMEVIDELQQREQANEEQLRKLVAAVQAQLRDFDLSKKAAKAYAGPMDLGESRFIDRKK